METMLQDVKYALPPARPAAVVCDPRRLDAGAGHRRLDGAVQRHRLGAVAAAAVSAPGGTGHHRRGGGSAEPASRRAMRRRWPTFASGERLTTIVSHAGMGRVGGFVPLIVDTGTPRAFDGRRSLRRLSRDLRHHAHPRSRHSRGRHARRRAGASRCWATPSGSAQFGGDPNVLGRSIQIQDRPVTIVGVLPAGFYQETAVWQARQFPAVMFDRRGSGTPVIARLRPGVTLVAGEGGSRRRHAARHRDGTDTRPGSRGDRVDVRRRDQPVRRHDQHAGVGGRADPGHRLRQRRRADAGARRDAPGGAGDPRGDRRRARTIGPAAAHREPAAGAGRRSRRRAARLCVARFAGRAHSVVAAGQFAGRRSTPPSWRSRSASPS